MKIIHKIKKIISGLGNNQRMIEFYKQFIGKNNLFFDIGANVGDRTFVFRKIGVAVVAVEPQNKCAGILKKKFQKDSDVSIVQKGIGDKPGKMKINICSEADTISTFSEQWKTESRFKNLSFDKTEEVQIITLEDLVVEYGIPDFCKIDVEGYELPVILGLKTKIPCISFEFTSEFIDITEDCLEALFEKGYTEFNYTKGEEMKLVLTGWLDKEKFVSILKDNILTDSDLWGDIYAK
ncbi:MAG: hypothetical protein COU29_04125 [Candidatus Magasanikbacteria bacterium CG10_big_fil_rev_8_21_14_0_10_36_32]|uniref:Methyltransferase FkbM domain-containing protein n=1 Tax=Candidatus Magasanikbacteria bacterium CG10_big_fil_rev_8_21_14_0_10_36_32 TaxID=1974646 RepID=A0A2M6W603_9BACT|nr:MAG: hypothetical protein COU29_04125 [Candidatus Magasanikbacteria bacterium CG10_big_fil_rev_8_21_14_0_10_36_32]